MLSSSPPPQRGKKHTHPTPTPRARDCPKNNPLPEAAGGGGGDGPGGPPPTPVPPLLPPSTSTSLGRGFPSRTPLGPRRPDARLSTEPPPLSRRFNPAWPGPVTPWPPSRAPAGTRLSSLLRRERGVQCLRPSPTGRRSARGSRHVYAPCSLGNSVALSPPRLLPFWGSGSVKPKQNKKNRQLLAVDHSARASMKNAASCEN